MRRLASMLPLLVALKVPAQAPATPPIASPADTVAEKPVVLPVIESARELSGKALVDALRKGGFVLYMRHAQNAGATQPPCTQGDLTPAGEEQARTVGAALKTLGIPIGQVMASELCRTQGTAKIVNVDAKIEITEDLNPVAPRPGFDIAEARQKRLSSAPPAGTNALLVSHMHGGRKKTEWLHLEMAEIIVFRPDGKGDTEPVARIALPKWAELMRQMAP